MIDIRKKAETAVKEVLNIILNDPNFHHDVTSVIFYELYLRSKRLKDISAISLYKGKDYGDKFSSLTYSLRDMTYDESIEETIKEIDKYLNKISDNEFILIFAEIIDITLKDSIYFGVKRDEYYQPEEVTKLLVKLANVKPNESVYNPFCGFGSYFVEIEKNLPLNQKGTVKYFGEEISGYVSTLTAIRLYANRIKTENFFNSNSFYNLHEFSLNKNSSFDVSISTPPWGITLEKTLIGINKSKKSFNKAINLLDEENERTILRLLNEAQNYELVKEIFSPKDSFESYFLFEGIKFSNRLLGIVSGAILFSERDKKIRKELIDNDYIETIISLPANIYNSTSISSFILILTKNKKDSGIVKFIDATTFIKRNEGRNILDYEKVLNESSSNSYAFVRFVSTDLIIENDYDLSPNRYFISEIKVEKDETLVRFSNLVATVRGVIDNDTQSGRFIKVSDLEKEITKSKKNSSSLAIIERPSNRQGIIYNIDVLLLSQTFPVKPTFFTITKNSPVICCGNILAYSILEDIVSVNYLLHELRQDYVTEQLTAIAVGSAIKMLRGKDLSQIKIKLVPLEKQAERLRVAKEIELQKYAKSLEIDLAEKEIKYRNQILSRKHALGTPKSQLRFSIATLKTFLDIKGTISNMDLIDLKRGITVSQHIELMNDTVADLCYMIDQIDKMESNEDIEVIDLKIFVQEYLKHYSERSQFRFDFYYDEKAFFTGDSDSKIEPNVRISRLNLKELFNNTIANAISHGFVDKTRADYCIRINMTFDSTIDMIVLKISNNGKQMPEGMNEIKYRMRGETAGISSNNLGIGGARNFEIAESIGGVAHLYLNESDYPVELVYNLPRFIENE